MYSVESSLRRVKEDVLKLDKQIENVLRGLLSDGILEEGELLSVASLPNPEKPPVYSTTSSKTDSVINNSTGLFSSKRKKNVHSDAAPVFDEPGAFRSAGDVEMVPPADSKSSFSAEDIFLVPILDKWIFGATFLNCGTLTQKLPTVMLNIVKSDGTYMKELGRSSICYHFKSELVNTAKDFDGLTRSVNMLKKSTVKEGCDAEVRAGSKFFVSVCFPHPLIFSGDDGVSVLVSLLSEGKPQWSKSCQINFYASLTPNEVVVKQFQEQIFQALCHFSEHFTLSNLPSDSCGASIEDFLENVLKLRNSRTIQTCFDQKIQCYYTNVIAFLWGSLVYIERCDRNPEKVSCLIRTRTEEQLMHLNAFFTRWLEEQKERVPSLKISSGSRIAGEFDVSTETLMNELKTLLHFIYLNARSMFPSSRYDSSQTPVARGPTNLERSKIPYKWLKAYVENMNSTDQIFMI